MGDLLNGLLPASATPQACAYGLEGRSGASLGHHGFGYMEIGVDVLHVVIFIERFEQAQDLFTGFRVAIDGAPLPICVTAAELNVMLLFSRVALRITC
jgi:hypothetical protein